MLAFASCVIMKIIKKKVTRTMTNHNSSANATLGAPHRHCTGQQTWQEQQRSVPGGYHRRPPLPVDVPGPVARVRQTSTRPRHKRQHKRLPTTTYAVFLTRCTASIGTARTAALRPQTASNARNRNSTRTPLLSRPPHQPARPIASLDPP